MRGRGPAGRHASRQFFLTARGVLPVRHERYVELVAGRAAAPELAGQTLRLADWYVRMHDGAPQEVVNETYSWLVIDEARRADLHAAGAVEGSPLPSATEREEIRRLVFTDD